MFSFIIVFFFLISDRLKEKSNLFHTLTHTQRPVITYTSTWYQTSIRCGPAITGHREMSVPMKSYQFIWGNLIVIHI